MQNSRINIGQDGERVRVVVVDVEQTSSIVRVSGGVIDVGIEGCGRRRSDSVPAGRQRIGGGAGRVAALEIPRLRQRGNTLARRVERNHIGGVNRVAAVRHQVPVINHIGNQAGEGVNTIIIQIDSRNLNIFRIGFSAVVEVNIPSRVHP